MPKTNRTAVDAGAAQPPVNPAAPAATPVDADAQVIKLIDELEADDETKQVLRDTLDQKNKLILATSQASNTATQSSADLARILELEGEVAVLEQAFSDHAELIAARDTEISDLKRAQGVLTKEVPGTYEADNGNTYRFKTGHLKINFRGEVMLSEEVIQDDELMEELIDMEAGCIEIVPED